MTIKASVIVPTYHRPDLLARCLLALTSQDFPASEFEILVADNAGAAVTERQVRDFAARSSVRLRYIPAAERPGPAAARNAACRQVQGEFLAFTDDDCIPDRGWLGAGVKALEQGLAAAGGRIVMPLPPKPTDYERNEAGLTQAEFATANCFCRREAFGRVGGFDESFTAAWREDSDLHFALLEAGYAVGQAADAVVLHPVRPAPWGISLRQQQKSIFNALLYKKHPNLYRQRIQPRSPWRYYAMIASLGLAVIGAGLRAPMVAVLGAASWLGLTAQFCWMRLRATSHDPVHVLEMVVTSALIPWLSVLWRLRGAWRFRVLFF